MRFPLVWLGVFLGLPFSFGSSSLLAQAKTQERRAILEQARAIEKFFIQTIEKVRPTVVVIRVERKIGGISRFGGGSGVFIDKNGYILTNEHVIHQASRIWVGVPGKNLIPAKLLGVDKEGDLAVLKIPGKNWPVAQFGDSQNLKVGQWVLAMGNPFSLAEDFTCTVTKGIISGLHRVQGGIKMYGDAIQTDAGINPGNSGGPLFDMYGKLIGINGRISIREGRRVNVGVGYAIPVHQIKNFIEPLKRGENVRHAFLGVSFSPELKKVKGVRIQQVLPNSSAAKAGLRPGDVIIRFQGQPIRSFTRLQNLISVLPAGTKVTFTILRNGVERKITVKLGYRR